MSPKAAITLDEAMELIAEIAREGEGPERFRALKLVMAQQSSSATLPLPLTDSEKIDRLARLMKAVGSTGAQLAYKRAFSNQRRIDTARPRVEMSDVPGLEDVKLPKNLPAFYRMFPEVKRQGWPRGYPARASAEAKTLWIQRESKRILLEREQIKVNAAALEAKKALEETTDAPQG